MLWPINNSYKEFDNEKKFLRLENSPLPHNQFSNGQSPLARLSSAMFKCLCCLSCWLSICVYFSFFPRNTDEDWLIVVVVLLLTELLGHLTAIGAHHSSVVLEVGLLAGFIGDIFGVLDAAVLSLVTWWALREADSNDMKYFSTKKITHKRINYGTALPWLQRSVPRLTGM